MRLPPNQVTHLGGTSAPNQRQRQRRKGGGRGSVGSVPSSPILRPDLAFHAGFGFGAETLPLTKGAFASPRQSRTPAHFSAAAGRSSSPPGGVGAAPGWAGGTLPLLTGDGDGDRYSGSGFSSAGPSRSSSAPRPSRERAKDPFLSPAGNGGGASGRATGKGVLGLGRASGPKGSLLPIKQGALQIHANISSATGVRRAWHGMAWHGMW